MPTSSLDKPLTIRTPIFYFLFAILLFVFSWHFVDYQSDGTNSNIQGIDSGVFSSVGMHLNHGVPLYEGIWDHKQPLIYILNAAALSFGEGISAIRAMDRISVFFSSLLLMILLRQLGLKWFFSALILLLFFVHVYNYRLFDGGNYTELYAVTFVLAGIATILHGISNRNPPLYFAAAGGILLGIAPLFKEPFLFSIMPWVAYYTISTHLRKQHKRTLLFLLGLLFPSIVSFFYLLTNGILWSWVDMMSFQFGYSENDKNFSWQILSSLETSSIVLLRHTKTGFLLFALFFLIASLDFIRTKSVRPLYIACGFSVILEFLGASLSGRNYEHYYIQMLPSFFLCIALSLKAVQEASRQQKIHMRPYTRYAPALVVISLLAVFDHEELREFFDNYDNPARYEIGAIGSHIKRFSTETDEIWVGDILFSRIYTETNRLSAARYAFFAPHSFRDTYLSTAEEKTRDLAGQLAGRNPKFVVTSSRQLKALESMGILAWIHENYNRLPVVEKVPRSQAQLFARKQLSQ